MANGALLPGPGSGWVDTASRVIVQVGFPVVVAGVLLWFLLTKFQDNMGLITARMAANTEAAAELVAQERATFAENQKQSTELLRQSKLIAQIATDARTLVDLRKEELGVLQRIEGKQKQQ